MPWFQFTKDYDHRWPSGAITEFPKGSILNVKKEVAEHAKELGAGEETSKPKDGAEFAAPAASLRDADLATRRTPRKVVRGGTILAQPGNPFDLPDPADPEAERSEPLVETDGGEGSVEIIEPKKN